MTGETTVAQLRLEPIKLRRNSPLRQELKKKAEEYDERLNQLWKSWLETMAPARPKGNLLLLQQDPQYRALFIRRNILSVLLDNCPKTRKEMGEILAGRWVKSKNPLLPVTRLTAVKMWEILTDRHSLFRVPTAIQEFRFAWTIIQLYLKGLLVVEPAPKR